MRLRVTLESDTTFGGGDEMPGLVDLEVKHDRHGLPYLPWRRIKGLLTEECANILYALQDLQHSRKVSEFEKAALALFGAPGGDDGAFVGGDAHLPASLRAAVVADVRASRLQPEEVLGSLTAIRRQSAIDDAGAPADGSLRTVRVVLRTTVFETRVPEPADDTAKALLSACTAGMRRGGVRRNRGTGRLDCSLVADQSEQDLGAEWLTLFDDLTENEQS